MDSLYCLVRIILNKKLALYCIDYNSLRSIGQNIFTNSYPVCFTAKSSKKIIKLLSLHSYYNLLSINHAFYLSIELYKAELSIILNQMYIQD